MTPNFNKINNLFNSIRVSYRTLLNLINSKSIEEALSITINNNILIITSTSISSLKSITRSISVKDLVLTLVIRLFNILRAYRDISLDSLTLLIKVNFLKLYKS